MDEIRVFTQAGTERKIAKNTGHPSPENEGEKVLHILITDDDEQMIETLTKVFEAFDEPVNIKSSLNGDEAMRLLEYNEFDLIILDVNLPDIDGGDILKFIRTQVKNSKSKIIAISGVPFVLDSMLQLGADKCLSKPFRIKELREIIRGLI